MPLDVLRYAEDLLTRIQLYEKAAAPLDYAADEASAVSLLGISHAAFDLSAALARCGFSDEGMPRGVALPAERTTALANIHRACRLVTRSIPECLGGTTFPVLAAPAAVLAAGVEMLRDALPAPLNGTSPDSGADGNTPAEEIAKPVSPAEKYGRVSKYIKKRESKNAWCMLQEIAKECEVSNGFVSGHDDWIKHKGKKNAGKRLKGRPPRQLTSEMEVYLDVGDDPSASLDDADAITWRRITETAAEMPDLEVRKKALAKLHKMTEREKAKFTDPCIGQEDEVIRLYLEQLADS
jgi:hypothetical protein